MEEYINIKNIAVELRTEKKKQIDDKEKAWKEEKKLIKDRLSKLEAKSDEALELKKTIDEKDSEIKGLKADYKKEFFQKVDEPLSHFKTLTKSVQTQEVLYDVELVIHISAEEEVLRDIVENQNNLVSLGRSESMSKIRPAMRSAWKRSKSSVRKVFAAYCLYIISLKEYHSVR